MEWYDLPGIQYNDEETAWSQLTQQNRCTVCKEWFGYGEEPWNDLCDGCWNMMVNEYRIAGYSPND